MAAPPAPAIEAAAPPVRTGAATTLGALFCLGVVCLFAASIRPFYSASLGFTSFVHFGSEFYDRSLPALRAIPHAVEDRSIGYDGQFYAQMALEPLLRDRAIDAALDTPAYRARRILFSWTAYVIGLGDPARIVRAYALQNIVAWFLLAVLLTRWLPPWSPRHAVAWFACLFSPGLIDSVTRALLEGPSLLLFALAIVAIEKRRPLWGAGLLGLAALGRESNVVASPLIVERLPGTSRAIVRLLLMLAIVVLPMLAWSMYVRALYPSFTYNNPDAFGRPFAGLFAKWLVTINELRAEGWSAWARSSLLALTGLTVQAGFLLWRRDWQSPWWRLGAAYCILVPFLGTMVWEGYPGAAFRVLLPITVAFNILVTRSKWCWPLLVAGNIAVILGLWAIRAPFFATWYESW